MRYLHFSHTSVPKQGTIFLRVILGENQKSEQFSLPMFI